MHLYILTRGKSNFVRRFREDVEAHSLPYKINGVDHMLQMVMRPVQLWEVAFPEGSKDTVLSLIGNDDLTPVGEGGERKPANKWIPSIIRWVVAKLGLSPIPAWFEQNAPAIPRKNVGVHLIGLKGDLKEPVMNERI